MPNLKEDSSVVPGKPADTGVVALADLLTKPAAAVAKVPEIGGRRDGPEPTRYGDWEKNGRCIDF